MTVHSYLALVTTQPLLLRLAIAAILVGVLVAAHAFTPRRVRFVPLRRRAATAQTAQEPPREIVATAHFC